MHISFVGPTPPHRGGVSQHGAKLVAALRRNHTVDVVSWSSMYPHVLYRGSLLGEGQAGEVEPILRWWDPISWYRAGRRIRGSDLLVIQYFHPFHALAIGTVVRVANPTSAVAIVHNATPHERFPLQKALTTWALKPAVHGVVHSRYVAGVLGDWLKSLPITVVPHPPNLNLTAIGPPPRPPLRLLFLGYVRPYKGLGMCIDAIRRAVDAGVDVVLTVVGEFWEEPETYIRLVQREGLEERVRLIPGYVSDSDVASHLAAHHAVVAPYLSATQSGIIPLAFAAGRPAVVTNVGGLGEQVEDGLNGTVASGVTAKGVAEAIGRMANRYAHLQPGAERSVPTWEQVAAAVTAVFDSPSQA